MSMVSEIIARLSPGSGADAFALVEGAAEFAAIDSVPTAMPAAYVMTLREASDANSRATGRVLQRLETDIAVVIITSNLSDVPGSAVSADIEDLKDWVRGRLVGFEADSSADPIEHVSGELLKTKNGTVWWEEVFGAASYLTENT